ncbi:MAG TPA: PP2C family protein-serine/threonine phosphatase [Thermoanaerobaculia bacterium]|jgi:sigma-B regulation protein RsbU (phosphoserine phosphatase)
MAPAPAARSVGSGLLAALGAGLLALAVGAGLALALLPEWRTGTIPGPGLFRARFQEIVRRAGFRPGPDRPSLSLIIRDSSLEAAYSGLGEQAPAWLAATRSGARVSLAQPMRLPGDPADQIFAVDFSLDAKPRRAVWSELRSPLFSRLDEGRFVRLAGGLERLLLAPGEALEKPRNGRLLVGSQLWRLQDVAGSSPAQQISTLISPPAAIVAERVPATAGGAVPGNPNGLFLAGLFLVLPLAIAALVIFLALLIRSRIDLVNGAALALIALLSVDPRWLESLQRSIGFAVVNLLLGVAGRALWIFFVWSAGESLLRATDPGFSTSLDTLRRGRLGPRGGRSLLLGFALGSGLAGGRLALYALAVVLPGVSPAGSSVRVPIFQVDGSPLMDGIWLAAGTTLITALAVRFLPGRWVLPAAALLGGYALSPLQLFPFPAEWLVGALYVGALAWICRRFGLTTLLSAALISCLLPAVLYAGLHLEWMRVSFTLTALLPALLLAFGFVGISRPEQAESGSEPPPPFMRRLAQERRIHHEVGLLARMQEGLLPREMPRVEGYQVAARSVLASEAGGDLYDFLRDDAGRLWIAAGDVAGHGYSCAVAQAMVKAGLLSLVEPEESPAGVLRQLDRVLRNASTDHSFTSLSLIRLDPATGGAVLANAGHPYPLVAEFGRVTEIELPGLPLGRGPAHAFPEREFRLPPGAALVLCSDGLFEALDRNGNAFGFERAREVLRAMGHRPAVEIVDALLNDCRRHLGDEPAPDDVTVVVVKRG